VTRLRKIMLEELQRRNYSAITTRNYLRVVADFAKHFGKSPDKLGLNELRTYQAYLLRERKLTPGTVINRSRPCASFSSRHLSAISSAIFCLSRKTSGDCQRC
jgi:Phage integrase, N-terminal SAM-like domain